MSGIDAAEGVEKLSGFYLEAVRQIRRPEKRFFKLDLGLVVVVELEYDVREPFEVRIDRAIERDLGIAPIEAALERIVIAHFQTIQMTIARSREGKHSVERDVHVVLVVPAADDWQRLGQRRTRVRSCD